MSAVMDSPSEVQTLRETKKALLEAALEAADTLKPFIGRDQMHVMRDNARHCEEREFFQEKFLEMAALVLRMPRTYETRDEENPVAWLHYFRGCTDVYITELDRGSPDDAPGESQSQAYGLVDLYGDGGEIGYISLPEILATGIELDLYWKPKTLKEIRK